MGKADDLLYTAWTIIANVSEGDWDKQTEEWKEAAIKWRDEWTTNFAMQMKTVEELKEFPFEAKVEKDAVQE